MYRTSTEQAHANSTWKAHIESWHGSGISMAKWCKEHEVSYNQFIYHKKKLNDRGDNSQRDAVTGFIELRDSSSIDAGLSIECGDVRICLTSTFDEGTLVRCVHAIRKAIR